MSKEIPRELKQAVRFIRSPSKLGKGYYFKIPKSYTDNYLLVADQEYMVICLPYNREEGKTDKTKSNLELFWVGLE